MRSSARPKAVATCAGAAPAAYVRLMTPSGNGDATVVVGRLTRPVVT